MRRLTRVGLITLALSLGVAAFVLTTAGLSRAAVTAEPELVIELRAPEHVSLDAPYVVNLGYANQGSADATDNQISAILPAGVAFVESTTPRGDPWPPDSIAGNTLTWNDPLIVANDTWDHLYIVLQPQTSLQEGDLLTVTATISTSLAESKLENNTASVTSLVCEMAGSSKQVHARTILPGDVLTYTIRMDLAQQSGGGQNARWVTLTDTLPFSHQVRFLGWHGDVSGAEFDGHTLQWQGRVQAGEPLSLQYRLGVEGDVPPGTVLTNVAQMGWAGRHMQLGPITTAVTLPHGMLGLGPNESGQLQHQYGITLDIPPGAVTDTTRFQFRPLSDTQPITPPGGLLFAHRAFEMNAFRFGEEVRQFNRPLTITVHYTDTDVQGLKRETLRLWTREGPEGPWAVLGEPARVMSGALAFTTDHFSEFALFGEALVAEPALAVEVRAPEHVSLDAPYVVNLGYANQGSADATDNLVKAILPAGVAFVESTTPRGDPWPPDSIEGNTLTWNDPLIVANDTWDHLYIVLQPQASLQEGDLLTVTATISTSLAESDLTNNTASVTSIVSEMAGSSKQVHARTILPGDVLTYTISINLAQQAGGGQNARWVTLTDTLPFSHQVRFLGWHGDVTGTLIEDGHMLRWQGRVQSGEPLLLQYRLGVEGDVPPGTVLTNVAQMDWAGHHMQLGPITTAVTLPYGMLGLGPNESGQLQHQYGVTLDVPPGAVTDTTRFQFRPLSDTQPITPPGGLLFAHRAFEMNAFRFGEEVRQFNRPLTITVHYTDTDVQGLKRETLRLWTREGPEGPWAVLGEPARVMSGALAFTTDHFSEFALFGEGQFQLYLPLVIR